MPDASKTDSLSLSLHFNSYFPGGPGLAGTRMSPFWILLELRMIEVVVTTGEKRRVKLQSNRHHQQTNTQLFLQARCLSCRPNNSVRALKEDKWLIYLRNSSQVWTEAIRRDVPVEAAQSASPVWSLRQVRWGCMTAGLLLKPAAVLSSLPAVNHTLHTLVVH